jgi:hypothetical protein
VYNRFQGGASFSNLKQLRKEVREREVSLFAEGAVFLKNFYEVSAKPRDLKGGKDETGVIHFIGCHRNDLFESGYAGRGSTH